MDIPINAKIHCSNGPCGQLTHVILKPATGEITHLVISDESYPVTDYLVSIDQIADSTPEMIRLNCSCEELWKMPIFYQARIFPSSIIGFAAGSYMTWPYYASDAASKKGKKEHIPTGEVALWSGAGVEATDGSAGRVNEFLINPDSDAITHLVLREGRLWRQKDVTIPVSQIDHYHENNVYLKLDRHGIETLPAIPVRRGSSRRK